MKRHFSDYVYAPAVPGATTSDDIIKADVLATVIRGEAEKLMTGTQAVNLKPMQALEYRFQVPEQDTIELQTVVEGAKADFESITWFDLGGTLIKTQQALDFTDEVKIRQLDNLQYDVQIQACAQGFALGRDKNIFSVLNGAAGASTAATDVWTDPIAGNLIGDLAAQIGSLLKSTTMGVRDIANIKLFYPVELHPYMMTPVQIGEQYMSPREYITSRFGIEFIPNKYFSNDALLVYKSDRTAFHAFYSGSEIPSAETERIMGVGQRYLFTQYFQTIVMPDNKNTMTSSKIRKITGVI